MNDETTTSSRERWRLTTTLATTLVFMVMSALSPASGAAEEPLAEETRHTRSATLNVLGPTASVLAATQGFPSFVLNARYNHALNDWSGLTIAPNVVVTRLLTFGYRTAGVKTGYRLAPASTGLEGWFVMPTLMVGFGWVESDGEVFSRLLAGGVGLEAGYTWHLGPVALELGSGLLYAGSLSVGDNLVDASPPGGWLPVINLSVGYAW